MLPEYKGYGLALSAHVVSAIVVIVLKELVKHLPVETANASWFLASTVVTLPLMILRSNDTLESLRRNWRIYMSAGALMGVASTAMLTSLDLLGANATAFLSQFVTIFSVMLGIIFLGERIRRSEVIAVVLAVMGVLVMTFQAGDYFRLGTIVILLGSLANASHMMLIKKNIRQVQTIELVFFRFSATSVFVAAFAMLRQRPIMPSPDVLPLILVGSLLMMPMLNFFRYRALEYIDMTKVALLGVLQPLVVLILAVFFLHESATVQQLLGGGLVMVGVAVITVAPRFKHVKSQDLPPGIG